MSRGELYSLASDFELAAISSILPLYTCVNGAKLMVSPILVRLLPCLAVSLFCLSSISSLSVTQHSLTLINTLSA